MTTVDINVIVTGGDAIRNDFLRTVASMPGIEFSLVRHYGSLYQPRVRGHMSGRPGLRAITGDARRRVTFQMVRLPNGTSAANVFTNWVAARRHEFGFTGADSLGRHIPTPPRPAWGPPLQRTVDELSYALQLAALRSLGIT